MFGFEDTEPPLTPSLVEYYEGVSRLAADYPDVPIQLNHGANADPIGDWGACSQRSSPPIQQSSYRRQSSAAH